MVLTHAELFDLVRQHDAEPGVDRILVAAADTLSNRDPEALGHYDVAHDRYTSSGLWLTGDDRIGAELADTKRRQPSEAAAVVVPAVNEWHARFQADGYTGEDLAVRTFLTAFKPDDWTNLHSAAAYRFRQKWQEAEPPVGALRAKPKATEAKVPETASVAPQADAPKAKAPAKPATVKAASKASA